MDVKQSFVEGGGDLSSSPGSLFHPDKRECGRLLRHGTAIPNVLQFYSWFCTGRSRLLAV